MKTFYEYLNRKSKSINHILLLLILLSFSSLRTNATIRYVKQTATGLGNGISWANASNNLQAMIDASSPNDEVWVMAGTYKPSAYPTGSTGGTTPRDYAFILKNRVKIYGSFVGNETLLSQRNQAIITSNQSILSGDIGVIGDKSDNSYHVIISVNDDNSTVLDGFTITEGNANSGRSVTIEVETRNLRQNFGAGMVNNNSSPFIMNCIFINNVSVINSANEDAGLTGGGMSNLNSASPTLYNCSFINNSSDSGGGMSNQNSSLPTINDCFFSGNHAERGGAMFNATGDKGTTHKITNCIFWKNSAESLGGAICNSVSSQLISNCTFYGNSAEDGGAIQGGFSSSPTINNCIIWGNGNEPIANRDSEFDVPTINHTDIEGGYRSGIGNIDRNPSFIDPNDPDGEDNILGTRDDGLDLTQCSPAINKGDNASIVKSYDFIGAQRIQQSTVDMGAYESDFLSVFYQSRLYVKADATGRNNGTSWANAFTNLQSAFDFPCNAYDEIWVAAGTYKPSKDPYGYFLPANLRDKTFYLRDSKRLYGSFAGNENTLDQRTPEVMKANPTILSGDIGKEGDNSDNAYHVLISVGSGSGTALDGFTITNGNANSTDNYFVEVNGKSIHGNTGGGMINYESAITVSNCIFKENSASFQGGGIYNLRGTRTFTNCKFSDNHAQLGGGMYNSRSSPGIINCDFSQNFASSGGGLMNYDFSSPDISNCLISGNSAFDGGGIINQFSSSPQITNSIILSNWARNGSGIYNSDAASPTITNCDFLRNVAEINGGALMNVGASPSIRNCTIFGNSARSSGGGIYNSNNEAMIINSILWGNIKDGATTSVSSVEGALANITYSDIEGGYAGTGNINQDPLFTNQLDFNGEDNILGNSDDGLTLREGSPCINAGAFLDYYYIPDIIGAYRAQQGAFDMGAYESPFAFNQCQTLTWQQGGVTTCDGKATFTIKVNGLVGNNIAQFSIDKINWFDATLNGNTYTFTVPQQGICHGFFARPKGCTDVSKIIWGCYLDTYPDYPVSCEPCSSDLIWIQGGVITCNGKAKMTIKVLGLKVNTVAEFSIDNVNWYDATANGNTYTFTVPQQGICRSFWARPKGCTNSAKTIWGCYLDTYAGYPVICTDGQIPTASQPQSLRVAGFSMDEIESMSVETMPNPVNENLTVKIYLPKNTSLKSTLISSIGREMETKNFEGKSGENILTIDMKSYKPGMYLLWVQTEELRIVKKVIKIE